LVRLNLGGSGVIDILDTEAERVDPDLFRFRPEYNVSSSSSSEWSAILEFDLRGLEAEADNPDFLPKEPNEGSMDVLFLDEAFDWDRLRLGVTSSSSSDAGADCLEYPFD
jgi:hypothetical protein